VDDHDDSQRQLVERAQHGDAQAFSVLVQQYERTTLAIAYAVVGDASLAGDVAQEAFLRAWQQVGRLNDAGRFAGWLARIVRNLAADMLRSRKLLSLASDVASNGGGRFVVDPSREIDRGETKRGIDEAISSMDELTRSVVVLRYYEDLSSKQIAELLELSPGAVDMRLSRARAELRTKLADLKPQVSPCET
jgi:RNA polymerase sigma-70 factor, ECF subfamily